MPSRAFKSLPPRFRVYARVPLGIITSKPATLQPFPPVLTDEPALATILTVQQERKR